MSSPVFTTTVTSSAATARTSPRRNFPAPTPPASAVDLHSAHSVVALAAAVVRPDARPSTAASAGALARGRPAGKALSRRRGRGAARRSRATTSSGCIAVAARLRDLGHGRRVTYSRKVFIPLTMLCRDHCHYCTFAKPPAKLDAPFLTPEEVVAIAEAGRRRGCKEALFTLGDRPEDRYPVAREWLAARGYASTLDYVRAVAIRVIEETGLLPHLNPGVMSLGGDGAAEARERRRWG